MMESKKYGKDRGISVRPSMATSFAAAIGFRLVGWKQLDTHFIQNLI
jgi:hypothetical protein